MQRGSVFCIRRCPYLRPQRRRRPWDCATLSVIAQKAVAIYASAGPSRARRRPAPYIAGGLYRNGQVEFSYVSVRTR